MPEPMPIWPDTRDGDPADRPTLTLYPAERPTAGGAAVMVCPGGGYANLAPHEGEPVARYFNSEGFHAAVLHYRLGPRHRHPAMVQDAQRAMRLMRANAAEWGLKPDGLAVLGFSAGGHLASTLAVHFDNFHCARDDYAGVHSARPDAAVLCYPVLEMVGSFTHIGSRDHLLGRDLTEDLLNLMTTYHHVTPETPPTFLWHTAEDAAVPMENSLRFAEACRRNRVPVELHVYEAGAHGLGLRAAEPVNGWAALCAAFLRRHLCR